LLPNQRAGQPTDLVVLSCYPPAFGARPFSRQMPRDGLCTTCTPFMGAWMEPPGKAMFYEL